MDAGCGPWDVCIMEHGLNRLADDPRGARAAGSVFAGDLGAGGADHLRAGARPRRGHRVVQADLAKDSGSWEAQKSVGSILMGTWRTA